MRQSPILRAVLALSYLWRASGLVFERAAANATTVALSRSAPEDVEPLVSTHLSFSIEQDRWPDWTGIDSRNEFTHNALVNLQQLTGQPPKIRVGADSEDHTIFSPTVTVIEADFPPASSITPYPEATQIFVGDGFYQLSKWLPSGTHMIWGVNLGLDNVTNAVNMATSIVKAFGSAAVKAANVHLDLIEVGNEADLYKNNGLRPSNWTEAEYVTDWESIAGPVATAAGLQAGSGVGLQGAAFAGQGFTPTGVFNLGILSSPPGQVIKQISQHRYSGAFCSGGNFALASFMSKAAVRSNLTLFSPDVAEVRSKGFPYVLGETNSIACHGAPGVSNTAGAALWVIDYTLQAATLGMVETYFHEGIGFKYNFIQPISLNRSTLDGTPLNPPQPAHIQPAYYAAILVARAVGTTGSAQLIELDVPQDNISGYAIYEYGQLVRAVFINLDAWLTTSTGTRPSVNLALTGPAGATATVRRLTIQHADDVSGLTLGGQSYETANALVSGKETLQIVQLSQGVNIASSEAILLSF
ncbi:glycoside hydrolase family 79 protein [Ramaria rubella]|nr:glycoside hydrolase family 79 protein [Ramaria rubella]